MKVELPTGQGHLDDDARQEAAHPEQVVRKLRDVDAMFNSGKNLAAVIEALEVSESTYARWRSQYGGMKAEEAVRFKHPPRSRLR